MARLNILLGFVSGAYVLVQMGVAIWNLVEAGGDAVVPTWSLLVMAPCAVLSGFFFGRVTRASASSRRTPRSEITFDFLPESPLKHGWRLLNPGAGEPIFESVPDGIYGSVLQIAGNEQIALDIDVRGSDEECKSIEFVVQPKQDARFYAKVEVRSRQGRGSREVWLNLRIGTESPRHPWEDEWELFRWPEKGKGNWSSVHTDLPEAVTVTFGRDGWEFSKLKGFRLRGSMKIARIMLYE